MLFRCLDTTHAFYFIQLKYKNKQKQNFTCAAEKSLSTFDCDIYALVIYFFDDYLYDSLSPLAIYATKLYWCIHS